MSVNCNHVRMYSSIIIVTSITLALGQDDLNVDYDLPLVSDDDDYSKYYFRNSIRYDRPKLDPDDFFLSIYNPFTRALPALNTIINYQLYENSMDKMRENFDLEEISSNIKKAIENEEKNPNLDNRYIYASPKHGLETNNKYYMSNIYKSQLQMAIQYKQWQSLSVNEYLEVMIMSPKPYEDDLHFINARVEAGLTMLKAIPGLIIPTISIDRTMSPKLATKDTLLDYEQYLTYAIRMKNLGSVALHPRLCNNFYKKEFPDPMMI